MGVGDQPHAPAVSTPGKDPIPIVQEAGWAPWPVWTGAENFAPPGFDPRTVQPVASRYTDYATRATAYIIIFQYNVPQYLTGTVNGQTASTCTSSDLRDIPSNFKRAFSIGHYGSIFSGLF